MKTNPSSRFQAIWAGIVFLCLSAAPLCAEEFGLFTYRVVGGTTIEITDYPESAVGPAEIPAMIDGKSVTSIGDEAFYCCSALISVTIPEGVTSIGDYAFWNCSALTSVTIPSSVTSISYAAFSTCSSLTSVTIPSSVTSIGDWAFSSCSALTSVTIPSSVTSIGDGAFHFCYALTSVTIPEGVTSIGNWAFGYCNSLTSVTIPESVTSIGYGAFYCSALTSVTIPEGVTRIGQDAFRACSALTSVTIPSSVTSIGDRAFEDCSALTSVTIPSSVTSIGDSAFEDCSALTSVTIPEGVTSIGDYAFWNCSALTVAVFHGDAPSLGSSAFFGTAAGFIIYYLSGGFTTPTWEGYPALPFVGDMVFGPFAYRVVGGTTIEITYYQKDAVGPAEIPAMIDGKSVTSIGDQAFFYCSALTSVTIPEGVTSIGSRAFFKCSALTVAVFLGDAPSLGSTVFSNTAAGFTIYYLSGSTGFTTPTWEGYPAYPIDEALYPAASWLLGHGYPHTTNLDQDTTGDGVSLLMAYALNLNPNLNLAGSLPAPVLDGATLSMSFHAASPGIIYSVETSIDLNTWVTEGVTMSGDDNPRTASVAMDLPQRFLRLVVQQ